MAPAQAANTPIYKCFDKHLALVYTDVPCKNGELLDLRPGDADPAAVAGLEREREQLSLSAAQRIADERRAALQRELADRSRPVMVEQNAPDSSADYGYGYGGYPAYAYSPKPRPRPHAHRMAEHAGVAPNPPYLVPRP
ncbi:MAG TPA: hypothetical protein VLQ46_07910 [Casimicrobiaceae bacterium]|nr:hypothetical protein [Casimicrobiaceae bacterium]